MSRPTLATQWRLYKQAASYIRSEAWLIVIAGALSVILSFTNGFAVYSFLPVFDIVFQTNQPASATASAGVNPTALPDFGTAWQQRITGVAYHLFGRVAGSGSTAHQLSRLVGFIVILSVINSSLAYIVDYIFIKIQAFGTQQLRLRTFDHLTDLPLAFYNRSKAGTVISRLLNDIGGAITLVVGSIADVLRNVFLVIVYLITLLLLQAQLVLIILPVMAILGALAILIGRWVAFNRQQILELQADATALISEFLAGIKVIKGFSAEDSEKRKWRAMSQTGRKLEVLTALNKVLPQRVLEVVAVLITATIVLFGGRAVLDGDLSKAQLLLFFVVLVRFQAPVSALAKLWLDIKNGLAYATRAFDLLAIPAEFNPGDHVIADFKSTLELKDLSFKYDKQTVLHTLSATIAKGSVVAVVGPSGAGKSSLIDLLIRFYDPTSGRICLDGQDIREFSLDSYRRLFSIVTQETFLFHDTVAANITFGLERPVPAADIQAAAEAAYAHEFIQELDSGYQTVIGDRGVRLSGGQRQRLAIARALLRNSPILLLDEATSALDTPAERQVQLALDRLMAGRTTIVIAHRLSTIQAADQILVLHEGRLKEQGTHAQLLGQDGLYRHLWGLQQ